MHSMQFHAQQKSSCQNQNYDNTQETFDHTPMQNFNTNSSNRLEQIPFDPRSNAPRPRKIINLDGRNFIDVCDNDNNLGKTCSPEYENFILAQGQFMHQSFERDQRAQPQVQALNSLNM